MVGVDKPYKNVEGISGAKARGWTKGKKSLFGKRMLFTVPWRRLAGGRACPRKYLHVTWLERKEDVME